MKSFGPIFIFLAAILWASDAPFRLHLTHELSSNLIVLGEHFVDVLFVLPILFFGFAGLRSINARQWGAIIFIAIFGSALASVAFTQAFHYVNPSIAILLQKLQPLIAIGLSAVVLKERLHSRFWMWAVLALGGAYLISFPSLIPVTYIGEAFNPNLWGILLALVAAVCWGASTVLGKFALSAVDFQMMTALRFSIAFVFLIVLNLAEGTLAGVSGLTASDIIYIGIIACVSGVGSLMLYYYGLTHSRASVATLAELGFPLGAVVVNWIFIPGSALVPVQLAGMAILLIAVWGLSMYNKEHAISVV
jgi:drug/metabolite transporter (DMT)-like permease